MAEKDSKSLSRRGFMLAGAGGVAAIGTAGAVRRWNSIATLDHEENRAGPFAADGSTLASIAAFTGTMFGVPLDDVDNDDLVMRLEFAAANDAGWADEYGWLARHLDEAAVETGAASFVAASADRQDAIMRAAIARDVDRRTQKIRAFFQADGRELLRMRRSTIPHLAFLFLNSGVPWRRRGYDSWPGTPDRMLAYTRPVRGGSC